MSRRIDACFNRAQESGKKVLIPFVTAGDPDPGMTVALLHQLVDAGADLIEVGIPFSDPMADGPVIQASSERAIERGVDLKQVFDWVKRFREEDKDTPVVLMGYMNPFERFGVDHLSEAAGDAGVDGLLLVDCPPEEMGELQTSLGEQDIATIRLIAPTTSDERCRMITRDARGFVYYVSFKGTTGAGRLDADSLAKPLKALRGMTDLPIAVGFGIKDSESAVAVARHADGVVIGSALVEGLASSEPGQPMLDKARDFISTIRVALDESAG